jgi:hypothetical protein
VGRFDRESPEGLPPSIGTATHDLRATVEDKLREIVEAAEARAHEIEDRALEQALEIERDSEQKARRRFQSSSERAEQMIAAIDAFEREVAQSLQSLRKKGQALGSEFEAKMSGPPPAEASVERPTTSEAVESPPPASETVDADDAREGVRKRILDLFLAGKPRRDAEFMLAQIDDSDRYTDLLDEIYDSRSGTQQGSSRRRGGQRRRRPGN